MKRTQFTKAPAVSQQYNSPYGLNELSISEIKQKHTVDTTLDFQHEAELINQIQNKLSLAQNQYGITMGVSNRKLLLPKKEDLHFNFSRVENNYRLKNSLSKQKNMCFNKQLKRRKISTSNSKQKLNHLSDRYNSSQSLPKFKINSKQRLSFQSNKMVALHQNVKACIPIELQVSQIKKSYKISTKLNENEFVKNVDQEDRVQKFKRIYYNMPDDFKVEINDLNHNVNFQMASYQERDGSKNRNLMLTLNPDLKRSYMSKPQSCSSTQKRIQFAKKSDIMFNRSEQKIIQVSKPMKLQCRNLSFYSTSTQQQQSPFSKDSNSKTQRIIKRSEEVCGSRNNENEEYLLKQINRQNFYR